MAYVKQIEDFWRYAGDSPRSIMFDEFPGVEGAHWLFDPVATLEISLLQEKLVQIKTGAYLSFIREMMKEKDISQEKLDSWEEVLTSCDKHRDALVDSIDLFEL